MWVLPLFLSRDKHYAEISIKWLCKILVLPFYRLRQHRSYLCLQTSLSDIANAWPRLLDHLFEFEKKHESVYLSNLNFLFIIIIETFRDESKGIFCAILICNHIADLLCPHLKKGAYYFAPVYRSAAGRSVDQASSAQYLLECC